MAFKIIRDKASEDRRKIELIYTAELQKEIRRWSLLTEQDTTREREFMDRFSLVKKARQPSHSPEEAAETLAQSIKNNQTSLVQAQGNLDLEKLMELLS